MMYVEDWDTDTAINGGAGDGAAPQVRGGLLDPSTFPSQGSPAADDGPSIARPVPTITGPLDTDVHAQVLQDIQDAQARLSPISTPADDLPDEWMERSTPLIKHPLDTDAHAEVLQDVLSAQTKLPPIQALQDGGSAVFDPKAYSVLQAEGFDPTRLNGVNTMPSAEMAALAIAGAPTVAVTDGGPEKMTYMVPSYFPVPPTVADMDPKTGLATTLRTKPFVFLPTPSRVTAGAGRGYDMAASSPPSDALAVDHGHRDGISDGFVDAPTGKYPYGDTQSLSLQNPIPTATVSDGRVGWHVLDKGRLKFIYPNGSMTPDQIEKMQQNLNAEQQKFLRPK